jgi:hypothetical protein
MWKRHLYLSFDMMAITNEPLELGILNITWRSIVHTSVKGNVLIYIYMESNVFV